MDKTNGLTMNICHTARQSIVMEPRHGCKLEDLCRICGCKIFIDRKQTKVKKSYPCTYQCSSCTEEILQAFHIDTKKDSPEIHPQKYVTSDEACYCCCSKDSAQWSHMTGLSIPWRGARHSSTWPAVTCIRYISYRVQWS